MVLVFFIVSAVVFYTCFFRGIREQGSRPKLAAGLFALAIPSILTLGTCVTIMYFEKFLGSYSPEAAFVTNGIMFIFDLAFIVIAGVCAVAMVRNLRK